MCELVKRKINVIFCDEKRNPVFQVADLYGAHDTSNKIRMQVGWSRDIKEAVWTEVVREKVKQQMLFLEEIHKNEEANLLTQYITEMEWNDSTNREGHAAKVYFNALFGKDFTRTEDNFINAALNYGYQIILSSFAREIVSNGYLTQLGLFHDNMFNKFNLASDLMEPFRILIDRTVYEMKPQIFEHPDKMILVNVLNSEIIIDAKHSTVSNAIKIYTKSVFDAINEQDISLIRFYKYEL